VSSPTQSPTPGFPSPSTSPPQPPTDEATPWRPDSAPPTAGRHRPRKRQWYASSLLVIAAVTTIGAGLRLYRLSDPHGFVFDEVYYAKDGCFDAGFPFEECKLSSANEQTFTVHPPLGRWIIAGGISLFSKPSDFGCEFSNQMPTCHPFGFRVASAVFGTISVLLAALLALRLFGSTLWAGVAGLLLATENLNFVQSRVAMLDIFVTTFVLAGFLFLVLDRQWIERRTPMPNASPLEEGEAPGELLALPPDRAPAPVLRPWRILAGLAFGAAAATKWSAAPALAGAIALTAAWEYGRRKRLGLRRPGWETIRDEAFGVFVFLMLVPIAVYAASFAKWWADSGFHPAAFWRLQVGMADYSIHLRASHPYSSRPWWWLLLKRPVDYYYQGNAAGTTSAEVLGMGHPLLFWGSVLTVPYVFARAVARRDWRGWFLIVAFLILYLPWFAAARTSFLFYMAPVTPFMVLATVYVLRDLSEVRLGIEQRRWLAPVAAALVVVSVAMFVFFFPVLTGRTISHRAWQNRMWFGACTPKPTWCWI
jgi:dolichyl-phosphate-mannose-protein mannosyltransferase